MESSVYRFTGSQYHLGEGSIPTREVRWPYGTQTADKHDIYYYFSEAKDSVNTTCGQ